MSMYALERLRQSPNALAAHYSAFRVSQRLLFTGHSHQAWPDVGFEAQQQAWRDAAELVDDKWGVVMEKYERVCSGYADLLGNRGGDITLAPNTHELVVRLLSALPLTKRPRLVTTDAEFHSIRRQLDRLADAVDGRTAAILASAVFYERGVIVPGLSHVAETCRRHGAAFLVDAYHALGAIPFDLGLHGIESAFVVGGGYKYLQMGEGNCFLRTPPGCELRPLYTGWFSEFAELAEVKAPGEVPYGQGSARFAGSTFDPTSHYRGAAVMDFFREHGLTPDFLRTVSEHQVRLLAATFLRLNLDPRVVHLDETVGMEDRGGFLSLHSPQAGRLCAALKERGVQTDARGEILRFGPAPYLSDEQIVEAMQVLGDVSLRFSPRA